MLRREERSKEIFVLFEFLFRRIFVRKKQLKGEREYLVCTSEKKTRNEREIRSEIHLFSHIAVVETFQP